jgi:hypothetical protein
LYLASGSDAIPKGKIMDVQHYTEYEVIDSVTNESFVTQERYVALAHYKDSATVYENHFTVHKPTPYTKTLVVITQMWTFNPDIREEE